MKNITPFLLIILAIGLFFTYTNGKIQEIRAVQAQNAQYLTAINNSKELINERDKVLGVYNSLTIDQKANLDKMLPDNIDNVRLMIDMNNIASHHGITLVGLSTGADGVAAANTSSGLGAANNTSAVNSVSVSFNFTSSYPNFLSFLKDLESSLRILDITHMSVATNETGTYSYSIQLKTYWLSQ